VKDRGTRPAGNWTPPPPQRGVESRNDAVEECEPVPGDADGLIAGLGLMVALVAGLAIGSVFGHVAIVAAAGAVAGAAAGSIVEARDRRSGDRGPIGPR